MATAKNKAQAQSDLNQRERGGTMQELLADVAKSAYGCVNAEHYEVWVDRDSDTLCKCGTWVLHIHPGSFEKHIEDELLVVLRARLLALLEAGQAMRCGIGKYAVALNAQPFVQAGNTMKAVGDCVDGLQAWDKALGAA